MELVLGSPGKAELATLMDLNMLVMMAGRERSFAKYRDLLTKAGFGHVAITPTETAMSIITARTMDAA
jgi:hypothetical protein